MKEIELQFATEDDSQNAALQAAEEEKKERTEESRVEAEAAANTDMPRSVRSSSAPKVRI